MRGLGLESVPRLARHCGDKATILVNVVGVEESRGCPRVHVEGKDAKGGSGGVEMKMACCLFLRQSIKADCKKHLAESQRGSDVNGKHD